VVQRFKKALAIKILKLLLWCVEGWEIDEPHPPLPDDKWIDEPEDWRDDGGG